MTICAVGGISLLIVISLAMSALKVHTKDFRMTGRTVHRLVGGAGSLQMVGDLGMTLGALDVLVN